MITYRQTRKQRIREEKRRKTLKRNRKLIGAAVAGSVAAGLLIGVGQKKTDAVGSFYTVKKGDTLYSLAKQYDTSVEMLKEVNSLRSDFIRTGQKLEVPVEAEAGTYIVKKGDTLFSLAKKYGVAITDLKKENKLVTDSIYVGQALSVPTHGYDIHEEFYEVNAGDTLFNISKRFGVSLKELKEANGLKKDMVLIGQHLLIPGNIEVMESTVNGAADNFTVEFETDGKAIPLKVSYGTARKYQELAGQQVIVTFKNGALINIQ
ncbi:MULTISPECIES: LysM peptidoglycan-binding domain-containing protein [unclassified Mesobacillus]|uniref:LysM peptidoglycan-binding domain-containing protein n=1 Tax=unclassified Mesobacillus TaxID=2675270 RepID=UPI00203EF890|nr:MULTISPECIES: LysM peptidoglycan-binding domain-containing protein [unclassified Mesobacillus]MCM3123795.1 LysM peptidoglycan-binding domain-containing protein [Mesobacillus sp. MER 33]MCM3234190.1 LysM peptidoglycan-binding domain-containing protein [Mesobacillus sp. MER 48]